MVFNVIFEVEPPTIRRRKPHETPSFMARAHQCDAVHGAPGAQGDLVLLSQGLKKIKAVHRRSRGLVQGVQGATNGGFLSGKIHL